MSVCKSKRMCKEVGQGRPIMDASGQGAPDALRHPQRWILRWGVQQNLGELLKGRGPGHSTD